MATTPLLGMYVHMHWSYKHPYAARTWTVEDWRSYAGGLSALGYNLIMFWPMFETMPNPLTPSDVALLEKMRQVIDMLHDEFGMTVWHTMGPNTVGNAHAAEYTFPERLFFQCDERLNPADPAAMARLLRIRRELMQYLGNDDGVVIIDSDPGGYIGSTNAEFARLLLEHLAIIRENNPHAILYYWMWCGWEAYNNFWAAWEKAGEGEDVPFVFSAADCEEVVRALQAQPDDGWGVFSTTDEQHGIVARLGLQARTLFNPYGLIECEPSFPFTNLNPQSIADRFAGHDAALTCVGAMGNAQTHAVQLPHTYCFAHFAQGGALDTLDLPAFADGLAPGWGKTIAAAWSALWGDDTRRMLQLAERLAQFDAGAFTAGRYSGLLFNDPTRFFRDLILQLRFRAAVQSFVAASSGDAWQAPLAELSRAWSAWQQQTGFADAYYGPLFDGIVHPALRRLGHAQINAILDDFNNWRDPTVRHGIVLRLLQAMEDTSQHG